MTKLKRGFPAILLTALAFSISGFSLPSSRPPVESNQLPPLNSEQPVNSKQQQRKPAVKKKFSRQVHKLSQKDYDIKIVFDSKRMRDLFDRQMPQIGYSLLCADINGDHIKDIIVGAPFPEGLLKNEKYSGLVYVIFGRKKLRRTLDLSKADLVLYTPKTPHSTRFGHSLAAGDINGDGINDLILGAPHSSMTGRRSAFRAGEVYILYGKKGLRGRGNIIKHADVIISGRDTSDETGFAVSTGDINGDGLDDIIIGAPGANRDSKIMAGKTYIIFGRKNLPRKIFLSASWDVRLTGIDGPKSYLANFASPPDRSGSALATGDINNDGIDDLIIAAPYANGPDNSKPAAGEVYVVYGRKDIRGNIDLEGEADLTLRGSIEKNQTGFAVAAGDINGDRIDDIVIGTAAAPENKNWKVGVYAVYGRKNLPRNINLRKEADLILLDSQKKETSFLQPRNPINYTDGYSLALGDFNGDKTGDLIIGTPQYAGQNSGKAAYLITGNSRNPRIMKLPKQFGKIVLQKNKTDELKHSVAAGDINGDGLNDLIIRAPEFRKKSAHKAGLIFIIMGRK